MSSLELTPKSDMERMLEASIMKVYEEKQPRPVVLPAQPEPVPPAMIEKLNAPLPARAITPHPTKSYLSSIKPAYVIERLNEVFGPGGWHEVYEFVESQAFTKTITKDGKTIERPATMVVMKAYFTVPRYGIHMEAYGGNDNEDRGDAYKGACTDALTKIASHLGIGMEVYKGRDNNPPPTETRRRRNASDPEATDGPAVTPTAAQKAVADAKVEAFNKAEAELKAKVQAQTANSAQQSTTHPEAKSVAFVKPWTGKRQFIVLMDQLRERVGEVQYFAVLNHYHGATGVSLTNAAQFTSTEDAVKAYRELVGIAEKEAK